jgi:hypothetical protein
MEIWPTQTYHQDTKRVATDSGGKGEQERWEKFLEEGRGLGWIKEMRVGFDSLIDL